MGEQPDHRARGSQERGAGCVLQGDGDRDMSDWQPIQTAPKDGTPILLGWNNVAGRDVAIGQFGSAAEFEGVWGFIDAVFDFVPLDPQPTHWVPLPPPPGDAD